MSVPIKYDGKGVCVTVTKATKEEREALQVIRLTGSARLTTPNGNKKEIRRIRNLKMEPHHFDNLRQSMGGMGEETLMRTVRNTNHYYLEQIEEEKRSLPQEHKSKRLHGIHHKKNIWDDLHRHSIQMQGL